MRYLKIKVSILLSFSLLMTGKGLGAFDAWLDKRWDNLGILVAITLSLPSSPQEEDADAR
ncbi:TPA: hypothetical protein LC218_004245 [Salmonella enterica subsp. arizonae serovar 13,22:z4,z23:-]|nr:hypothetical protein [Salmonella enterica]HBJ6282099.1 hypothetical protein [Salmonella enterica subsp. arizonae serovar 13,22:z4,z23:-]EBO4212767.1 hypothetical protein [Salmonella enterica]EDW5132335.1 hypothetical protein [Salmonella enterica]EEF7847674.1 hypothetical protein [Salmonella enterica]